MDVLSRLPPAHIVASSKSIEGHRATITKYPWMQVPIFAFRFIFAKAGSMPSTTTSMPLKFDYMEPPSTPMYEDAKTVSGFTKYRYR